MDATQLSVKIRILNLKVDECKKEGNSATDPVVKAAFSTIQAYHAASLALAQQDLAKTVSATS
jgi:hypothetical protein